MRGRCDVSLCSSIANPPPECCNRTKVRCNAIDNHVACGRVVDVHDKSQNRIAERNKSNSHTHPPALFSCRLKGTHFRVLGVKRRRLLFFFTYQAGVNIICNWMAEPSGGGEGLISYSEESLNETHLVIDVIPRPSTTLSLFFCPA